MMQQVLDLAIKAAAVVAGIFVAKMLGVFSPVGMPEPPPPPADLPPSGGIAPSIIRQPRSRQFHVPRGEAL